MHKIIIGKIAKFIYDIIKHPNPYELLEQHDIVSFDIYDTLLKRDVDNPADLFVILEREMIKHNKPADGFAKCRIKAEKLARNKYGEFTTLDNIYETIATINPEFSKKEYKEREIDLEFRLTSLRQDNYRLYQYAIEQKKRVFLISDMYLPEKVISKLLAQNGIKGYEKLFVSCEYGVSKYNGDFFDLVHSKENIDLKNWLHIGDNTIADWLVPRTKGICAYNTERNLNSLHDIIGNHPSYSFEIRQMYKYIQNRVYGAEDYYRIGYSAFGPILYGVTKWLHEDAKNEDIDIILFAARDGYLFEKAYRKMPNRKEARYILISRKSLMLPMLKMRLPLHLYLELFFQNLPKKFLVEDFLGKIGFSREEIYTFMVRYGYRSGEKYDKEDLLNAEGFQKVYDNILIFFASKISDTMEAFYKCLDINYIKDKKVALFDIGARGTIQKCLEIILNKNIHGYYLYVNREIFNLKYAKGYVGNCGYDVRKYLYYNNLLELVFSAPHGSTKNYLLVNNRGMVIFDKYENADKSDYLDKIRKSALVFNADAVENGFLSYIHLLPQDYFFVMETMELRPSKKIIDLLGDFGFSDGCLRKMVCREHSSINLFGIFKDYKMSYWKIGFLYKQFGLLGKFIPLGKLLVVWGLVKYRIISFKFR